MSATQTEEIRECVAQAAVRVLGLSSQGKMGHTARLLLLKEEHGLGAGIPDSDAIGLMQDVAILIECMEARDPRMAAAAWSALRNGLDQESGKVVSKNPAQYGTMISRLRNMNRIGAIVHAGGVREPRDRTNTTAPAAPLMDEEHIGKGEIQRRLKADVQIAVLPPRYAYVPCPEEQGTQ